MSYVTFDVETTIKESFKRRANPFDKDNFVVMAGWKHKGGEVESAYYGRKGPPPGWLIPIIGDAKMVITFNGKFDILHALQDAENLAFWMKFVADGGILFDCQLAEYLLNGMGQSEQMLSLDEVAPRYGGNVKVDEVKALWKAGIDTPDIEPELLTRYLCGGKDEHGVYQQGDVENTEQIALAQVKRARECGQLNSILLNMGALLFTVEAERNGMYVDKAQGMVLADALKIKVDEASAGLAQYLPKDLPFDFNWNSPKQKSALFFGGTVQYDAYEWDLAAGGVQNTEPAAGLGLYSMMDVKHYLLDNGSLTHVEPFDAEPEDLQLYTVYKSGKNAGEYKTKLVKCHDYTKPKGRKCRLPYTFAGYTKPKKKWQGSEEGVYSTSAEVVEELADSGVPFLKMYAELMAMAKDLGTYYITTDEGGKQKGMLTLVDMHGIIHHKLNMCSTVTARLSSSDPNLQNIPKGNKSDIKTIFKSRFGGKLIQSDFSSLEVYVQAILTGCKQLIADLKAGLDMHCVKLAAKEGMEYEEVLKLAKGYTLPDGTEVPAVKEWGYKRTGAKEYSFQSAFGAGDAAIADKTGMALEDVARLRAADNERYPEIPEYYASVTEQIKQGRKPKRTLPHPDFPGVICHIGESYFRTPDGKLYSYIEHPAMEFQLKRGVTAGFMPTEIRNYVVQGTGGEWAKAAMWLSVRAFYRAGNFGGLALLVNQVHDAVYCDADNSVALEAAALLHACMEGASDFMEYWFKWTIPVPVPSDTSWGESMMDEEHIPGLKELAAKLRTELREQYMGGYKPSFIN